jgi:SAM-dependent methyltransferase
MAPDVKLTPLETQVDLEHEYRRRFQAVADYRDRAWKVLTRDFFQQYVPQDGTVLDLGCGWGEFISNIRARAKYGIDLNPEAEKRLASDVRFLKQDCSERWPLADGALDVVFSSNFLEHLPSKAAVRTTLAEAHRCLRLGGRLICLGPNIKYLPGAYWDFWDHCVPLTDLSLAELMEMVGFSIERRTPRFLPYSMSQGWTPPLLFLSAYLRMSAVWPLVGKQFLLLGRKL